jgi:hypothetical protein
MKEIERRIGQILVMAKMVNEKNCPFVPLIMNFNKEDLIDGAHLQAIRNEIAKSITDLQ